MFYDTVIVGAGPGGIFTAYELIKNKYKGTIAIIDAGEALQKRKCPIDGNKVKNCIKCKSCSIMNGFGGAGAFSDGKYTITNDFGGNLGQYIGDDVALELMEYVDSINLSNIETDLPLYTTAQTTFSKLCLVNELHLLNAKIRHLGTDKNYLILQNLYEQLNKQVKFYFNCSVTQIDRNSDSKYVLDLISEKSDSTDSSNMCCSNLILAVGRSGSSWMKEQCKHLDIPTKSNCVDIGVRVELNSSIFEHITAELYESKIIYKTKEFEDDVRTFCMNPYGQVVNENTNGIVTVNGHSFEDKTKRSENTNFALLVSKHFTEPFNDSNAYGEYIAKLSNMLGGGVIVQRFGDLIRGRRSTDIRIKNGLTKPTLKATPGDLSLVLPKRLLDDIIEMIYALNKIAPGTANDDTLLYGVEVKFYNMKVSVNNQLGVDKYPGLYIIGDGSGVTHSLAQASASGVYVARNLIGEKKWLIYQN